MRKDVTIDRRKVYCKNSSPLGYSSKTLYCGERFVFFDESAGNGDQQRVGRMIGRISACSSGDWSEITGRIVTIMLNEDLDMFERWVKPENVIRTYDSTFVEKYEKPLEKVTEFLTLDVKKHDVHKLRAFVDSGFSTVAKFDARHPFTHLADYSKEDSE